MAAAWHSARAAAGTQLGAHCLHCFTHLFHCSPRSSRRSEQPLCALTSLYKGAGIKNCRLGTLNVAIKSHMNSSSRLAKTVKRYGPTERPASQTGG